jgi:arylsulfatase A-like enzyme
MTAAAGAMALLGRGNAAESARPNILFVCTDQQHFQAYGAADPFFDTPNIDRLAAEGVQFMHNFCTTPQCSPSRSSLYTGLYPHKTGVIGNLGAGTHTGGEQGPLGPAFETVGLRLRAAGYHTGYFGKWHLGNGEHFGAHFDAQDLDGELHGGATDRALACMAAHAGEARPFALFVNYIDPHDIYQVFRDRPSRRLTRDVALPETRADDLSTKPWPQRHFMEACQGKPIHRKGKRWWQHYHLFYREKCRLVDAEFGRLLDGLDRHGLRDNTLVVFTSDHGDMDTNHNLVFKGPFMYEHLVRVPLIVRAPGVHGGVKRDEFALGVDLPATLCDFAGADAGACDGHSLRPALEGGMLPARDFVVGQYYGKQEWVTPIRMIRTREWKYNRYLGHGDEFYDLTNDPLERHNLADDPGYRGPRDELRAALDAWMKQHGDTEFERFWPTRLDGSRFRT